MKAMDAGEVIGIYKLLADKGILITIDGGWGIDALMGEQTRKHNDLDIAVEHKDVPKLREILSDKGYRDTDRPDKKDFNFVLEDDQGYEVDMHSYTFDENKKVVYGIPYPYDSLKGKGIIDGVPVRCIALEYVIQFHENYEPDEDDINDIKALIKKFNISPPKNYISLL